MAETQSKAYRQQQEQPAESDKKQSGKSNSQEELYNKIKESLSLPLPEKDEFWRIEALDRGGARQKKVFGLFKRRDLSQEEVNELRKSALQSPGNTRAKIQRLKKQYPNSAALFMLSAICTYGMLLNSSNQTQAFRGMKVATKEAAMSLISDGISVYNCDNFFRIYFTCIDRIKRQQARTLDIVRQDPRLDRPRQELRQAIQISDQMAAEKNRIQNVLNLLKKKLKSSQYASTFLFGQIKEATKHVELGNPKEKCQLGTAAEVVSYVYALSVAFARVPILTALVDHIISLFPEANLSMLLRRISINSVRNFTRFRIATVSGEAEKMARLGKLILKENMLCVQKLDGQSLYQSYETDPFFNLAFVAEMTVGLYKDGDHDKILNTALQAVESVIKRDMSKNHMFTEPAKNHTYKLTELKESRGDGKKTAKSATAEGL